MLRLEDLCTHAQLRARSLKYGFQEIVGLPPMAYVRMLRLGEVRTRLLDRATATRNISAIALDTGFSHVSQFIVDYRRVFEETPSTTRRNALCVSGNLHWPPAHCRLVTVPRPVRFADSSSSVPG